MLDAARDLVGTGSVGDFLTGEWLGHPLHPMLVDLPVGFWTSGVMIDLLMPRRGHDAARKLIGLGVVTAVPAALAGWADASRRDASADRRVSIVHAASMASATMMFAVSWQARRRDHHAVGKAWALLGSIAATAGGALGGHLAFGALTEAAVPEPLTPNRQGPSRQGPKDMARRDEDWLKPDSNVTCWRIPCLLLPDQ